MNQITYNSESRSFSISNFHTINGPWKFKLVVSQESLITKLVMNQMELTTYKLKTPIPIKYLPSEYRTRAQKVYDNLKRQCKEVPVIEPCTKFDNACYINGLDDIINKLPKREQDYQLRLFCEDLGCDFDSVKGNLGPHMVFIGEKFMSPEVIAHEFGHYLNTIGKGEPEGDKVHAKYGKAVTRARTARVVIDISNIVAGVALSNPNLLTTALVGSSLTFASIPLMTRPIILSEMKASQTGLKNLAKAGSSKEDLAEYDKFLKSAFNTYKINYVTSPVIYAILYGVGAGVVGYLQHKSKKTQSKKE